MEESTCVVCDAEATCKIHLEGDEVNLCSTHAINILTLGPNMIQLNDGSLYKRDETTNRFERMTDD